MNEISIIMNVFHFFLQKMYEGSHVLRVCLPSKLKYKSSGILLGYRNIPQGFICVLDVITEYKKNKVHLEEYCKHKQNLTTGSVCVLGIWQKYGEEMDSSICEFFNQPSTDILDLGSTTHRHGFKQNNSESISNQYLIVQQQEEKRTLMCQYYGDQSGFTFKNTIIMMFSPKKILASYLLMDHPYTFSSEERNNGSYSTQFLHNISESLFLYQNPTKQLSILLRNCKIDNKITDSDYSSNKPSFMFITALFAYLFYYIFGTFKSLAEKTG